MHSQTRQERKANSDWPLTPCRHHRPCRRRRQGACKGGMVQDQTEHGFMELHQRRRARQRTTAPRARRPKPPPSRNPPAGGGGQWRLSRHAGFLKMPPARRRHACRRAKAKATADHKSIKYCSAGVFIGCYNVECRRRAREGSNFSAQHVHLRLGLAARLPAKRASCPPLGGTPCAPKACQAVYI